MLDFQKRKKKTFDIALHDGTKLKIPTPTMGVFSSLKEVTVNQENAGEEELLAVLRDVLNSNKQGVVVTEDQLREFDLDDIERCF